MNEDLVSLKITSATSGQSGTISGWKEVRLTRAVDRVPNSFTMSITQSSIDAQTLSFLAQPFDICQVSFGADLVLTGYVDDYIVGATKTSHTISIRGRGKCQDLLDCSAEWPGGQIGGANALQVAQNLAKPMGIKVTTDKPATRPIPTLNLMYGETPWDIIERNARYTQQIAYEQADGSLILTQVGSVAQQSDIVMSTQNVRGNVEEVTASFSGTQRFSQYDAYMLATAALKEVGDSGSRIASVTDPSVPRRRLKAFACETTGGVLDYGIAQQRAVWERNRRNGASFKITVKTDSWRDSAGTLWTPNALVDVIADVLHVNTPKQGLGKWVIGGIDYEKTGSGTSATLTIMPALAYSPEPGLLLPQYADVAPYSQPPVAGKPQ